MILAIETSCDETAAAIVTDDGEVRSSVVASQADLHSRYGGVVPEVASRRHLELVSPVVREALDSAGAGLGDVERVAVTQGPGLVGALLVGISAAKAIAWARRLPLVPVDHLDGHVASLAVAPAPSSPPSCACSQAVGTRSCWPSRRTGRRDGSEPRSTTPPVRRSTRAHACSGSGIRAALPSTGSRRRAIPTRSRSPWRVSAGSTSRSPASRPRCSTRCATSGSRQNGVAPTWPPRTSTRSCEP